MNILTEKLKLNKSKGWNSYENKICYLFFLIISLLIFSCEISAEEDFEYEIIGEQVAFSMSSCLTSKYGSSYYACWFNPSDMGFRFTLVDSNGHILANTISVDYFSNVTSSTFVNNMVSEKYPWKYTYYKKNKKGSTSVQKTARIDLGNISIYNNDKEKTMKSLSNNEILQKFLSDSKFSSYYKINDYGEYYLLIEPVYLIGYGSTEDFNKYTYVMGTGVETVDFIRTSSLNLEGLRQRYLKNVAYNMYLSESIIGIKGVEEEYPNEKTIPNSQKNSFMNKIIDRNNGYNSMVIILSDYQKKYDKKEISCPIDVSIQECGITTITEPTEKECVLNNPTYVYQIGGCNLYCSDSITTNFTDFYKTFVGTNKLSAIASGKYIQIKNNPKIIQIKTCYQENSNDCPNWKESLQGYLTGQYNSAVQNNAVRLNIDGENVNGMVKDGNFYDLKLVSLNNQNRNSIINLSGNQATITYEYELDGLINKYISIKTMKQNVFNSADPIITLDGPSIITEVGSYGTYNYTLDLSQTILNKYSTGSKSLVSTIINNKYIINQSISINYKSLNGNSKSNYTSTGNDNENDLCYTCNYQKYDPRDECICEENSCCDSSCKVVSCDVCECTSEFGCIDDGKCTPIDDPTNSINDNDNKTCNPEIETCFPNVVYRPISLTQPFPGIDGTGRTPGSNWNYIIRETDDKVVTYNGMAITASDYYIKNNRGYEGYEIYQSEPLYVIKLAGDDIRKIRDYNDAHNNDYNDFNLTCNNGKNCISKFLNTIVEVSGTCKDSDSYNFDSCITRKGA